MSDAKRTTLYSQNYFSAVSDLHSKEVAGYLSTLTGKLKKANDEDKFDGCKLDSTHRVTVDVEIISTAFTAMAATQTNKGGAITRSKTMMDNLRRNDTKKVKRNEGGMEARQVILFSPFGVAITS